MRAVDPARDEDLRELAKALEDVVAHARRIPLTSQVMIDRGAVYDVLDRIRGSLPEAIVKVRWFRQKRESEGDRLLRTDDVVPSDVLETVNRLDDLMHDARPVPLTLTVRVDQGRIAGLVHELRSVLVPLGQELADYQDIYGTPG